ALVRLGGPFGIVVDDAGQSFVEGAFGQGPPGGVLFLEPGLEQVVEEPPGQQIPLEVITELEPERTNRVVEALVLIEHLLAGRGYVEGVVVVHEAFVWGTEDADEDVLEHVLTLEEVVLDVALLDTGEALLEGDEDLPAVERLRAVGDQ